LISQLDRIKSSELNVRIISAISEELFNRQSQDYKNNVLPPSAKYNLMIVSTGTKRIWPVSSCGPLTEEYSLVSDWNDQWLSGGSETEVLEEAQLDPESIYQGIYRFANDYEVRKQKQSVLLNI
jgi:transketolase